MASQHRLDPRRFRRAAPALPLLLAAFATSVPAQATEPTPSVSLRIHRLSPAVLLSPEDNITLAGVVKNSSGSLTDVRVRMIAGTTPFTTHADAHIARAKSRTLSATPVQGHGATDKLGNLKAGQIRKFTVSVKYRQLGLAGVDGVYAVGARVSTASNGQRHTVAATTTLVPLRAEPKQAAPVAVLWPLLMPTSSASEATVDRVVGTAISANGQLRNLLDLAMTTPRRGSDIVVDPRLLTVVRGLKENIAQNVPNSVVDAADDFLDDVDDAAQHYSCKALGFDRPDYESIATSTSRDRLFDTITRATEGAAAANHVGCTHLEWPTGISRTTLNFLGRKATPAVIVPAEALPEWKTASGNLLVRSTPGARLPLIVNDPFTQDSNVRHILAVRQQILSESMYATIARQNTPRATAVIVIDPHTNPGRVSGSPLKSAFYAPVLARANLSALLGTNLPRYTGPIVRTHGATPVSPRQVAEAARIVPDAEVLDALLTESDHQAAYSGAAATAVSQRWRGRPDAGQTATNRARHHVEDALRQVSVEVPRALTLSSRAGQFPVTIRNKTPYTARMGVVIDSSVEEVTFAAPPTVDVAAGESRTITVDIDTHGQPTTTMSVHLTTPAGMRFGRGAEFNVRSSHVGAALWVAMGLSVLFVAFALARRFARPGHKPVHATLPPEDFDD